MPKLPKLPNRRITSEHQYAARPLSIRGCLGRVIPANVAEKQHTFIRSLLCASRVSARRCDAAQIVLVSEPPHDFTRRADIKQHKPRGTVSTVCTECDTDDPTADPADAALSSPATTAAAVAACRDAPATTA